MSGQWRLSDTAPRFWPLLGALSGAAGGGVYWLAAQIWPTSIAVVLSMLATAVLSGGTGTGTGAPVSSAGLLGFVFALLLKYNALMALSAANLPFALPPNLALGLIMIAGHAASRALVVSVLASPMHPASRPASHADIGIALAIGFAPAALIGIPGLIGLVAAITSRIVFIAYIRRHRPAVTAPELDITRQLTEVCFYLGALATWAYI
jgi:adenosylcobinamide-GDP ribazoletransferase